MTMVSSPSGSGAAAGAEAGSLVPVGESAGLESVAEVVAIVGATSDFAPDLDSLSVAAAHFDSCGARLSPPSVSFADDLGHCGAAWAQPRRSAATMNAFTQVR